MKKTVKTILLSLLVIALCGSVCFAENSKFTGTCTYDGSKINSDFTSSSFAASIRNLEPGDSVDYTITYKNGANELTRWYMKNSVLETLEENKEQLLKRSLKGQYFRFESGQGRKPRKNAFHGLP